MSWHIYPHSHRSSRSNYFHFRSDNKRNALEETKNFTTQSLASVAYQINTLASNYIQLLDLQANNLAEMESQMNYITQAVMIHKEKVARREIGILTANKVSSRQYKIVAPSNPEKPIKYVRKPIDYSLLDDIGHGLQLGNRNTQSKRSSTQSAISTVPPPTTKPPTPPNMGTGTLSRSGAKIMSGTGTIGKSRGGEYRPPAQVVPPQVPSHYAPNYPVGHPRRQNSNTSSNGGQERPGYSALPMPPSQQVAMQHHPNPQLLHPLQHQQSHYDERTSQVNMPPPPSPLTITHSIGGREVPDQNHIGLHTLSRNHNNMPRPGSQSPPLPPPPEENADFGRPRQSIQPIVPEDQNLPGWVPKNYIEKGEKSCINTLKLILMMNFHSSCCNLRLLC